MVNCNPETVSTDYDTSDRLYFEPLTAEDVLEIVRKEQANGTLAGVIVQFGGQTPLKLANTLRRGRRADPGHSAPTPSTWPKTASGSRHCCKNLISSSRATRTAMTAEETIAAAREIGYPGDPAPLLRAGRARHGGGAGRSRAEGDRCNRASCSASPATIRC